MCSFILKSKTQFCTNWANYNHPHLFLAFFHPGPFSTWMETEMTDDFLRSRRPCFPKALHISKTKPSWHCLANEKDLLAINLSSFETMIQRLCPPVFEKGVNSFYSVSFLTILSLSLNHCPPKFSKFLILRILLLTVLISVCRELFEKPMPPLSLLKLQ